ncbi:RNA polymerase sigma factor sigC like [Actinidia chinensis var. chinensis]|uniref:RNA polymerase sigma factor sigC like n=1 Tax=Actinidia chinensis var. chinensis TaxID=1590841 RepID=A0A2R6PD50_ACTCC|nr:RNA polymerase sigma factor sigC like [Actinidia chinensis var. chinensis]
MGVGFRLNLKWVNPVQSPSLSNSPNWPSSSRGRERSCDSGRVSFAFSISWQSENLYNDPPKAHRCSCSPQTLENDCSEMEGIKRNIVKTSHGGIDTLDDNIHMPIGDNKISFPYSLQATKASHFGLLLENLDMLEATFADSNVGKLESDILTQLERLGALKLFHACLSRTLKSPTFFDISDSSSQLIKQPPLDGTVDVHVGKLIVHSRKKGKRKSTSERVLQKASVLALHSKPIQKDFQRSNLSSAKRLSKARSRRLCIASNEAEMSRGVKLVEDLEIIKTVLEKETGQVASLSSWAEAVGVDAKVLQQRLHFGWCCRDELLRSSRSLVVYLARNYRGLGVAIEDLIQAGNFGVLQGAVRFDHTKGYRFSTYVQYWIRKSMSTWVERHSRGIRIPRTLRKAINQIQNARKALNSSHMKYPDDEEIARFTGLSLVKITSASKCLRVVGSIDQKMGDWVNSAKFLECTPDTSIKSPEEVVMRQHMTKDLHDLLETLEPRERQVLVHRFGLGDHQRKSLEEIGRLFRVSKEWIRKIERTALTKLKDEKSSRNLIHYLYL